MAGIMKKRKGRKGAIKSAAMGILAVIILIGIAKFWGLPNNVAQASFETVNKVTDDLGLEELISMPKITSVDVTVGDDGTLNVNWKANKDGRRILSDGSTDIRVTFLRRELPEAQLEKYCVAYKLNTGAENAKEEAEAKAKGVWCKVDPDGIGRAALNGGTDGSKPAPGGDYTAIVAVKEKDNVGFGEGTEDYYKFYTEEFVELLGKPIQGCDFPIMNDCNVIECKKTIMNRDLQLGPAAEVKRLTEEIVKAPVCATYDPSTKKLNFVCSKEQVGELNKKFARVRMLIAASGITGGKVKVEDDYRYYAGIVEDFKQFGIINSLVCSNGEGSFKGAYGHLNSVGWTGEGTFDKWSNDIAVRLDNVLAGLKPGIASIKADAFDDRHLGLSWKVPVGENMVKAGSYKISQFHTKWAGKLTIENQKVLQSEAVVAGQKGDGVLTSFDTAGGQLTGKHEFEVKIFEKPEAKGSEFFLAKASTGLFDDAYIETYKGGVEGECIKKGLGDDHDPLKLEKCDVDAQKREELATLENQPEKREKVLAAIEKSEVEETCKYEKKGALEWVPLLGKFISKYWLSDKCTPEEVDRVWKNYMAEVGRPSDYNCVLPLGSEGKNVCIVKRQTVNTLLDRGWKDLRVSKGWENNV